MYDYAGTEREVFRTHVGAKDPLEGPENIEVSVSVKRVCPAVSQGHACWCTGACHEPITESQEVEALMLALRRYRGI